MPQKIHEIACTAYYWAHFPWIFMNFASLAKMGQSGGNQCDQIMMWRSSKPQSVTDRALHSFAYCYVSFLALPAIIIPAIATTRVHSPTQCT